MQWKGKTTVSKEKEDSLSGSKNDNLQNSSSYCRSTWTSMQTVSMGGCYRNYHSINKVNRGKLAGTCWYPFWRHDTSICAKRHTVSVSWWVIYQFHQKSHSEVQEKRGVNLMRGKQMLKLQKANPSFSFYKS